MTTSLIFIVLAILISFSAGLLAGVWEIMREVFYYVDSEKPEEYKPPKERGMTEKEVIINYTSTYTFLIVTMSIIAFIVFLLVNWFLKSF